MKNIKIRSIVLDCDNMDVLSDFYATFLGWEKVLINQDFIAVGSLEEKPLLLFQKTLDYKPPVWPSGSDHQQQMAHIDFEVDNLEKAVDHAISCGATIASEQFSEHWKVLLDPAGHPFCLNQKQTNE